jgi:nitrile hydratase accessory protein
VTSRSLAAITSDTGATALPRQNGELVFEAPWESRAFGVAIALHDAGAIDFEVFRTRLIAEIGDVGEAAYYECWLRALEQVLLELELVSGAELEQRAAAIEHDWAHDHEHLHDH